jgi:hypothetical protein
VSDDGTYYAAFIEQELKFERERRATLDTRGQAVVTTSGALLTLVSAITAIAIDQKARVTRTAGRPLPVAYRARLVRGRCLLRHS